MLRVAARSGGGRRTGGWGGSRRVGQSNFGRGRTSFARSRLFGSGRRVLVKIVPLTRFHRNGRPRAPLSAHIAYLKREGVTRDGSPARMFDANGDGADDRAFADRCKDDRHHFRIIVSPEDAADLTDLREYTRDLVRQMEADLGRVSNGSRSITGTPTIPTSICSCAASMTRGPTSLSTGSISATICARAPRNWPMPNSAPSPSMKSSARSNAR
ncbi:hypothetical protein LY284_20365 [Caballeronia sp. PC1]|nr:hypothetical protein [Caballeronia sp. PC1]